MNILKKEFVCKNPVQGSTYYNEQGGLHNYDAYVYIYIYDDKWALSYVTDERYGFAERSNERKVLIQKNLDSRFNSDSTKRKYKIFKGNQIEMQRYNSDKMEWQLSFVGEILLNGDVIKGRFYNDGKLVVPLRVYYNIDKPLPDPLILEEEEEIDSDF